MDTSQINLLELIPGEFRRKNQNEYAGACPGCGGRDRFVIWTEQNKYWCRQCGRSGDAIQYLRDFENMSFTEACERLKIVLDDTPRTHKKTRKAAITAPNRQKSDVLAMLPEWQDSIEQIVRSSRRVLWQDAGNNARQWLFARRLSESNIRGAMIGFNPQDTHFQIADKHITAPAGIIIPWWNNHLGRYDRLNVRVSKNSKYRDSKYIQAAGGFNAIYRLYTVRRRDIVVLVEGELDALACRQTGFKAVATGSTSGGRLLWHVAKLSLAKRVLVAFDNDANSAGEKAAQWWLERLPNARRLVPSYGKDCGDMLRVGCDFRAWIGSAA